MKLTQTHTRLALTLIGLCAAGILVTLLISGPAIAVPQPLAGILLAVLAVGGIAVPVIAALTPWSDPRRLAAVGAFALPLFSLAIFMAPNFDVFPARILCVVGLVLSFAGTVVVLFNALDQRPSQGRPAPSRFS